MTVDRATIDFTDKMLKVTLAQSMEGLKVRRGRHDEEFEVIDGEEMKESESPTSPSDRTLSRT